jgi:PPK2 family polyphosphate:nucleotide phosphotransferase
VSGRDSDRWIVPSDRPFSLAARDPGDTRGAPGDEDATREAVGALKDHLRALQDRLYAESERALLVVLQAMDAGGKDGAIKHVFRCVNPQGVRVTSFIRPTEDELAHDFLWRVHAATPAQGVIGIFNRSHYEDVLVARVRELVPEHVWRARYDHINAFEALLAQDGRTHVLKVFLHISAEEQAERLRERLERPDKRWKFRREDVSEREHWDDYMAAYQEAIERTSTEHAPWYVVPADHKWFRDWAVTRIVIETLEAMDPRYPEPAEDLDGLRVA